MDDIKRTRAVAMEQAYCRLLVELQDSHAPPFTATFISEHFEVVWSVLQHFGTGINQRDEGELGRCDGGASVVPRCSSEYKTR